MGQPQTALTRPSHQAAWFLLVGAVAAGVHFLALTAWVQWAHRPPAWANIAAFAVAFCASFSGHYHLTFKTQRQGQSWRNSLWRWLLSSVLGFIPNQILFVWGLHWFGQAHYRIVWFVVTVLVTVFTFSLGKWWAFRQQGTRS